MKLSILVPVYNEIRWIRKFWSRLKAAPINECTSVSDVEIIVVDDGSTDGTADVLREICVTSCRFNCGMEATVHLLHHEKNRGKGAAVRTAVDSCVGDIVLIQDSDLEYSMDDYPRLIEPIAQEEADAVFGSRFVGYPRRVLYFWHSFFNKALTTFSNMLCDLNLTDMETGYKVVRGDLIREIRIESNRFGLEPELTSRLARGKARIFEVPISYRGRTYIEGKKIGIKDGLATVWHIIRFGIIDREPFKPGVRQALTALDRASDIIYVPILDNAMANCCGGKGEMEILEIGSGIGTLTERLVNYGKVTATDISGEYVRVLSDRFRNNNDVVCQKWDATQEASSPSKTYDLIVCFNVLEHIEDDEAALRIWRRLLKPNGYLIVLVPNSPRLYSGIDKALGHYRRYTRKDLESKVSAAGFTCERVLYGNALGMIGWFVRGRVFGKSDLPVKQIEIYALAKRMVGPVERRVERYTGLSIICIAKNDVDTTTQVQSGQ